MTDDDLIARLREGQDLHVLAAIRIEELAMLRRTSALDALAAYGQAQDAHEAQLEAEAKLDKVVESLREMHKKSMWLRGEQSYREFARYVEKITRTTLAEVEGWKDE